MRRTQKRARWEGFGARGHPWSKGIDMERSIGHFGHIGTQMGLFVVKGKEGVEKGE
jgi:hypothetical protein